MKPFTSFVLEVIQAKPAVGYFGAAVPTATGFWVLIETATKIGACVSIMLGIAVAIVTLQVQLLNKKKLNKE